MKYLLILFANFLIGISFAADLESYEASFHLILDGKNIVTPNWEYSLDFHEKNTNAVSAALLLKVPSHYEIAEAVIEKEHAPFNQKIILSKKTSNVVVFIKNSKKENIKANLIIELKLKRSRMFLMDSCQGKINVSINNDTDRGDEYFWGVADCVQRKENSEVSIYKLFDHEDPIKITMGAYNKKILLGNLLLTAYDPPKVVNSHSHRNLHPPKMLGALTSAAKMTEAAESSLAMGIYSHYKDNEDFLNYTAFLDVDLIKSNGKVFKDNQYWHIASVLSHDRFKYDDEVYSFVPQFGVNFKYIDPLNFESKSVGFLSGNLFLSYKNLFISPGYSFLSTEHKFVSMFLDMGVDDNHNLIQLRYTRDDLKYPDGLNQSYYRWSVQIGKYF